MSDAYNLIPTERIASRIFILRGEKVMLDFDLADLFGVQTKRLNERVKRNQERFPEDFMFRLSQEEVEELNRSQIVTGSQKHRDPRYPPRAFTEHGILMLSNVLRSERAVEVSIQIVRAFVQMRRLLATHEELANKVEEHDQHIAILYEQLKHLLEPPESSKRNPIGFKNPKKDE